MNKAVARLLIFLSFCLTFVWMMGSDASEVSVPESKSPTLQGREVITPELVREHQQDLLRTQIPTLSREHSTASTESQYPSTEEGSLLLGSDQPFTEHIKQVRQENFKDIQAVKAKQDAAQKATREVEDSNKGFFDKRSDKQELKKSINQGSVTLERLSEKHQGVVLETVRQHMAKVRSGLEHMMRDGKTTLEFLGLSDTPTEKQVEEAIQSKETELAQWQQEYNDIIKDMAYSNVGTVEQSTFNQQYEMLEFGVQKKLDEAKEWLNNYKKIQDILNATNAYEILGGSFFHGDITPQEGILFESDINKSAEQQIQMLQDLKIAKRYKDKAIEKVQQTRNKLLQLYKEFEESDVLNMSGFAARTLGVSGEVASLKVINNAYKVKVQKLKSLQQQIEALRLPQDSFFSQEIVKRLARLEQAKESMVTKSKKDLENIQLIAKDASTTKSNKKLLSISFNVESKQQVEKAYAERADLVAGSELPEANKKELLARIEQAKEQLIDQLENPTQSRTLQGVETSTQKRVREQREQEAFASQMKVVTQYGNVQRAVNNVSTPAVKKQLENILSSISSVVSRVGRLEDISGVQEQLLQKYDAMEKIIKNEATRMQQEQEQEDDIVAPKIPDNDELIQIRELNSILSTFKKAVNGMQSIPEYAGQKDVYEILGLTSPVDSVEQVTEAASQVRIKIQNQLDMKHVANYGNDRENDLRNELQEVNNAEQRLKSHIIDQGMRKRSAEVVSQLDVDAEQGSQFETQEAIILNGLKDIYAHARPLDVTSVTNGIVAKVQEDSKLQEVMQQEPMRTVLQRMWDESTLSKDIKRSIKAKITRENIKDSAGIVIPWILIAGEITWIIEVTT